MAGDGLVGVIAPGEVGLAVEDSSQERRPLEGSTREHRPVQVFRITDRDVAVHERDPDAAIRLALHVLPARLHTTMSLGTTSISTAHQPDPEPRSSAFVSLPSSRTIHFLRRTALHQGALDAQLGAHAA